MIEFYFLFALTLVWIIFAVVQDLRTREIANWLNFSLIAFVLAYRAFYSVSASNPRFFLYGLLGVLVSIALAYMFYYGKIFAGGDAKLLMGVGGALPYATFQGMLIYLGVFVFALFLSGALWTIAYSAFLIPKNKKEFVKSFKKSFKKYRNMMFGTFGIVVALVLVFTITGFPTAAWFSLVFALLPFLFMYVKSIEESCMIKKKSPKELQIGDWLVEDVKIGNKIIKKTVHGLMPIEIAMIKKAKKKVLIKDGVPFTPAFLFAYLSVVVIFIMGFSASSLGLF